MMSKEFGKIYCAALAACLTAMWLQKNYFSDEAREERRWLSAYRREQREARKNRRAERRNSNE